MSDHLLNPADELVLHHDLRGPNAQFNVQNIDDSQADAADVIVREITGVPKKGESINDYLRVTKLENLHDSVDLDCVRATVQAGGGVTGKIRVK